jgi:putative cell wall-binding protein
MVAEEFFPDDCNSLVLAYGQNFPDGLSGGPLALSLDAPLILTTNDKANYTEAAEFARKKSVQNVVVLGGTTLISDETVQRILG